MIEKVPEIFTGLTGPILSAFQRISFAVNRLIDHSSAEIPDSQLSDNVPLLDSSNTFAGNTVQTIPDTSSLRLEEGADVSLSSTGHALQIGLTSAQNLALDNNEIMSRNNGAADELHLNAGGGLVGIGNDTTGGAGTTSGVLQLRERSASPGGLGARGRLWVRNDSPNTLMFTDDAGNDFVVNLTPA